MEDVRNKKKQNKKIKKKTNEKTNGLKIKK